MHNLSVIKVDLDNCDKRKEASVKLQQMEKFFLYPLGNQQFHIRHGYNTDKYDYFSYFEQLGKPYFFAIIKNDKVVGSICFILRNLKNEKVWYICDLKVLKEEQSKKITFILYKILKEQLASISDKFYFINMSPLKNNGLLRIASMSMKGFYINTKPLYFYQGNNSDDFFKDKIVMTNKNKKDIVIEGVPMDLYHVVNHNRFIGAKEINSSTVPNESSIMQCSFNEIPSLPTTSIGVIAGNCIDLIEEISTFEI